MGSGEVVHIMPNWDSDSDGSASLVVHKWNRIPIPEADRRCFPTGGRENSLILNKFLFMSSHKCLKYHLQLGIHLPPTWGTDFQAVCSKTPNDLSASHTSGLLMEEIRRSPVEVGSISHYLQGFIHPRWLFGISEPSTVCWYILWILYDMKAFFTNYRQDVLIHNA